MAKKKPDWKKIQEKKALNRALEKLSVDAEGYILTAKEQEAYNKYCGNTVEEEISPVTKQTFLRRAEALIKGDRQKDYGDKLANFAHIAMFFQAVLAPKLQEGAYVTPEEVGMMMQGVKMARMIKNPNHADSVLDNAGYAGCIGELQAERLALKKPQGAIKDANDWMIPEIGN